MDPPVGGCLKIKVNWHLCRAAFTLSQRTCFSPQAVTRENADLLASGAGVGSNTTDSAKMHHHHGAEDLRQKLDKSAQETKRLKVCRSLGKVLFSLLSPLQGPASSVCECLGRPHL